MTQVVDTNVALVVKHRGDWPEELADACEEVIEEILMGKVPVVTDLGGEIVEEYFHELSRSGGPTLGDEFARYVHDYRFTWEENFRPDIEPDLSREYSYRVLDGDDAEIDRSDRKFVAVAKVAGVPVIEATDTKWLDWTEVLTRHGVSVRFVHEDVIRSLYESKFHHSAP